MRTKIILLLLAFAVRVEAQSFSLVGEHVRIDGVGDAGRVVDVIYNYPAISNAVISAASVVDATNYAAALAGYQAETNVVWTNYLAGNTNDMDMATNGLPVIPEFVEPKKIKKYRADYGL